MLIDIAAALEYSYARRIVHRDLKPSNVLLDGAGRPLLADFGAGASEGDNTSGPPGSPFSASPQQLAGEPARPSDDIYGLGALAYELLSGYPPFYPAFDAKKIATEPVPRLKPVKPITPRLELLVSWLLAKQARERPPSMRHVADEMNAVLQDTLGLEGAADTALQSEAAIMGAAAENLTPAVMAAEELPPPEIDSVRELEDIDPGVLPKVDELRAQVVREQRARNRRRGWSIAADWTDGGILVVRAFSNADHTLYLVDPATGQVEHLTPHEGDVQYGSPHLLPDGSVLCATDLGSEFRRLAVLRDGEPEFLTPDTADVEEIALHGDRRAWTVNEEGYGRVVLDGEPVGGLPDGVPGGLAFSPGGERLALHFSQPDDTTDVWVVEPDRLPRRVTRSARGGLGPDAFRRPELERVESFDGLEVPYLRYGPRDAPTLCWVHGGPESQERPALNAVVQYLVARGLTVAAPNVRGSTGYGRTYEHLDDVEKRLDSVADLAALARHLGAERGVPVGVMGGSYGGYMTLAAITEHPTLWRAAVDVVGIASFVTFLERTGAYRRALREAEYGSLEHDRAFLESISPLAKVDAIVTPLMVIHGASDPRVPVEEAEQIVTALRERGREVEYLRYDDEGHGLVRLANRLDAYPQVAAFLERHLLR